MTSSKATEQQDAVVAEIEIEASPERVLRALTDSGELLAWWSREPSVVDTVFEMDARPGGLWRYEGRPARGSNHGDVGKQLAENSPANVFEAHGEVLECIPARLLVWTWIANWHKNPRLVTTVRWELTPKGKKTLVRVTHRGLKDEPISRQDYIGGWAGVLKLLLQHLSA